MSPDHHHCRNTPIPSEFKTEVGEDDEKVDGRKKGVYKKVLRITELDPKKIESDIKHMGIGLNM
jgi:hypothetical protein